MGRETAPRHLRIGDPVRRLSCSTPDSATRWTSGRRSRSGGQFTTVCAYRPGRPGSSDLRPPPHGAASAVDDLHALLGAAGLPAPYVLVGASFGGLDPQLYAALSGRDGGRGAGGARSHPSGIASWRGRCCARARRRAAGHPQRRGPDQRGHPRQRARAAQRPALSATVPLVVLRHGRPFEIGPRLADRRGGVAVEVAPGGAGRDEPAVGPAPRRDEQPPDPPGPARPRRRPRSTRSWTRPAGRRSPRTAPPTGPAPRRLLPTPSTSSSPTPLRTRDPPAGPRGDRGHARRPQPRGRGGRRAVARPVGDAARVRQPPVDAGAERTAAGDPGRRLARGPGVGHAAAGRRGRRGAAAVAPDGATIAFNRRGHEYLVASGGGVQRDLGGLGGGGGGFRRRDVHERRRGVRVARRRQQASGRTSPRAPARTTRRPGRRTARSSPCHRRGTGTRRSTSWVSTGRASGG